MSRGVCDWADCRRVPVTTYLQRELCAYHWHRFNAWVDTGREPEAREKIGLPPRERAAEGTKVDPFPTAEAMGHPRGEQREDVNA